MPQLSVIIPVYNVETYLRPCLDSVLGQSLQDMEIICVDDGSTDHSPDILAEYAARDARLSIITQENRGLSGARNAGLAVAKAPYITFVDSDDSLDSPAAYEKALAHMADPGVDLVAFGVRIIGDASAQRRYRKYFAPHFTGRTELTDHVLLHTNVCVWNKIFRRSIIECFAIRFPEGAWYEDEFFFHAYASMARCAYFLPDTWYRYTRRPDSITGGAHTTAAATLRASRDALRIPRSLAQYWQSVGALDSHRRLLGHIFFGCAAHIFAEMRHAPATRRDELRRELLQFATEMRLDSYPEHAYTCNILQQNRHPKQKVKYGGGLLCAKQSLRERTLSLLGLPLWQEAYRNGGVVYKLFSCLPLYRKDLRPHPAFAQNELRLCATPPLAIDDSRLLAELRALGPFAYQPNDGNLGDALIAAATMQWMDTHRLPWRRLKPSDRPDSLVYGGGGIWTPDYIANTRSILQQMQRAKRVLILPSSFRDVPELVRILDERFVIFCREQASYTYLRAQNTGARILLDHDMALRARLIKRPAWWRTLKWSRSLRALKAAIRTLPASPCLYRQDAESTACRAHSELDLSDTLGWFRPTASRARFELGAWALCAAVADFQHIYTDRLHVGIAALLCGVRVTYRDNSYGKISAVCSHSLINHPLVEIDHHKA